MRQGLVAVRDRALRYAVAKLAPSILTWAGIWNMVWIAGMTLRNEGVRGKMTVSFWWERGEDITMEAREEML